METAAFYFKLMEKFCDGRVVVQDRNKKRHKKKGKNKKNLKQTSTTVQQQETQEELERIWDEISPSLAIVLANEITLPEEDHPIPFDATLEKTIDDQK